VNNYFLGFHRLAINGLNTDSNQPLYHDGVYLICNGEIYNYKDLCREYNITLNTESDCEIIIHLYKKVGLKNTITILDGVFAFVLLDITTDTYYIGRDPIGIRSLYYVSDRGNLSVCSEMKGINQYGVCAQFPPGHFYSSKTNLMEKYYLHHYLPKLDNKDEIQYHIQKKLEAAVKKRLMSDRPIGCILSGGLDSTLITALVCKHYKPYTMNTYTIGLEGSVDLKYAKIASDYLKTNHHEFVVSEEQFLGSIKETIKQVESYCTTTVRASVGNYLISKYISETNKDVVIFCGDVADEIFGSYRGLINAPDENGFYYENLKLIEDIHYFDVLRSDKSIAGAGLEARVPFGDKDFVQYVMSIKPSLKMFDDIKIEKLILRESFQELLPEELIYRRKEAFSDGVSSLLRSWYEIIQEFTDTLYTDEEFNKKIKQYHHNQPYDKESLYYREVFDEYYPNQEKTIPYFWKQPFSKNLDPSARLLGDYKDNKENIARI
jgi:asparagine synthase (glutamine-hydrolysing)